MYLHRSVHQIGIPLPKHVLNSEMSIINIYHRALEIHNTWGLGLGLVWIKRLSVNLAQLMD